MDPLCLQDIEVDMLRIRCRRCMRRGEQRVTRLIERHGADMALADLKVELAKECQEIGSPLYQGCDVYFPQLEKP